MLLARSASARGSDGRSLHDRSCGSCKRRSQSCQLNRSGGNHSLRPPPYLRDRDASAWTRELRPRAPRALTLHGETAPTRAIRRRVFAASKAKTAAACSKATIRSSPRRPCASTGVTAVGLCCAAAALVAVCMCQPAAERRNLRLRCAHYVHRDDWNGRSPCRRASVRTLCALEEGLLTSVPCGSRSHLGRDTCLPPPPSPMCWADLFTLLTEPMLLPPKLRIVVPRCGGHIRRRVPHGGVNV